MKAHARLWTGIAALALTLGVGTVAAQQATTQDKDFLKNTAQDSNYEIKTAQLALGKSSSADVKTYARMLIQDHTALKRQTRQAAVSAHVEPVSGDGMSLSDDASYAKLKLLSGKSFEDSYIKGLTKGNEEAINNAKSEASGSSVPAIKKLAEHRVALDTKHAEKARQLAQAHGVAAK